MLLLHPSIAPLLLALMGQESTPSPLVASLELRRELVVMGQENPLTLKFTNTGKERVKLDPAMLTGLGIRIRPVGAANAASAALLDASAFGKEAPYEVPPGGSISCSLEAAGVCGMLAGQADTVELWFEANGVKSAPIKAELLEDLTNTLVVFQTNKGTLKFRMDPVHAPYASRNFVRLAQKGGYDGTFFHRVLKGFMAQGGDPNTKDADPNNDGSGGMPFNGRPMPAELSEVKHLRGTLSMARNGDPAGNARGATAQILQFLATKLFADPKEGQAWLQKLDSEGFMKDRKPFLDSAGSQFFLCFGPTPMLDGNYTAFGQMVEGDDVLKQFEAAAAANDQDNKGKPKEPLKIEKASVEKAK